ncbi:class I SAM-dependent methyltransferase, partial [Candidatus Pelagibacter sp.]|nr:class I SAM-dependent methyltransferase [Candidatus Pelagibacter sp.]
MTISSFELFNEIDKFSLKHKKYFEIYDKIFSKYRNKKIIFVEIGVLNGGSLKLWKKFFGNRARIIGIDLNPECKKFEEDGIEIFIGDQSNENFWDDFFKKIGKIDILLDDGGHTNLQQVITTVKSIKNINDGGILVVEDTHTSYMREFSNPGKNSYINFSKKIIDDINYTFPELGSFKYSFNQFVYS